MINKKIWIDDTVMIIHPTASTENQLMVGIQSKSQECSCVCIFSAEEIKKEGLRFLMDELNSAKDELKKRWEHDLLTSECEE